MMPYPIGRLQSTSLAALVALAACAPVLQAQVGAGATIDPGMTRAQVEERLGAPKVVRAARGTTYLFYANQCGRKCGTDDLVVLEEDAVADALFRSPARHYSGRSSSPAALSSAAARPARLPRERTRGIRVGGGVAHSAPGSIVIGGAPPPVDSTSAANAPRLRTRRAAGARIASHVPSSRARANASAIRISSPRPFPAGLQVTPEARPDARPSGPQVPAQPDRINPARTGARSTTGPVDARAAVQNAGTPAYPNATSAKPSPALSGADRAGPRQPFQGAQLAPTDSASASTLLPGQQPAPTRATQPAARPSAPRPDSTRP